MPRNPPNMADILALRHPKRLRNTFISVLICAGLMAAYYISLGSTPIPADTEIGYDIGVHVMSQADVRLRVAADGSVSLQDARHVWRYRISQFALRRILHAFDRTNFLDQDVGAYSPLHTPACDLSLAKNHRKLALRYDCNTQKAELATPLAAIEQATRFKDILAGDRRVIQDYRVQITRR